MVEHPMGNERINGGLGSAPTQMTYNSIANVGETGPKHLGGFLLPCMRIGGDCTGILSGRDVRLMNDVSSLSSKIAEYMRSLCACTPKRDKRILDSACVDHDALSGQVVL